MAEEQEPHPPVLSYATPSTPRDHRVWAMLCICGSVLFLIASLALVTARWERLSVIMLSLAGMLALAGAIGDLLAMRSQGGRRQLGFPWISILLFLASGVVLAMSRPRVKQGHPARVVCSSNLRQIGTACAMYAMQFGGEYPDCFERLLSHKHLSPELFCCYSTGDQKASGPTTQAMIADFQKKGRCSYVYVGAGFKNTVDPAAIIAYEPLANHGGTDMNVLFGEGHVEFVGVKEAQYILAELAAGHNPPRKQGPDGKPIGP